MKLGLVTTWNIPCGIAEYSRALKAALDDLGAEVVVLSCADPDFPKSEATGVWTREGSLAKLTSIINEGGFDAVHVQHEFGLFRSDADFLTFAERCVVPLIITLHTVHPFGIRGTFARGLAARALLTHTGRGYASLRAAGVTARIEAIPHGVPVITPFDKTEARRQLEDRFGIPATGVLVSSIGFLAKTKSHADTTKLVAKLLQQGQLPDDTRFVLAGRSIEGEGTWCKDAIRESGSDGNLFVVERWLSDDDSNLLHQATDVAVLNRWPSSYSASGAVAMALGYGIPILAKTVPIHDDVDARFGIPFADDVELTAGLLALVTDPKLRVRLSDSARHVAAERSWPKVARRHLDLYRCLKEKNGD